MAIRFPERLETSRLVLSWPAAADLPDLLALHTNPAESTGDGRT